MQTFDRSPDFDRLSSENDAKKGGDNLAHSDGLTHRKQEILKHRKKKKRGTTNCSGLGLRLGWFQQDVMPFRNFTTTSCILRVDRVARSIANQY